MEQEKDGIKDALKFLDKWRWLIFLAVYGVLATLAIQGMMKPWGYFKHSEAKTNLGAIYNLQNQYRIEKGSYSSGPDCFDLIEWKPAGQNLYNYVCGSQVFDSKKADPNECFVPPVSPASKNGFTVYAIANIDFDATCDVWSMDDAKNLRRLVDDIKE